MMKNTRMVLIGTVFLAAGAGAVFLADHQGWLGSGKKGQCKHGQSEGMCPWCDRRLVEKGGECAEHGGPKAKCWLCSPRLIAGYRAENDWCSEHKLPDSRCVT